MSFGWGCRSKYHTWMAETTRIIVPQAWRLEGEDPGVGRAGSPEPLLGVWTPSSPWVLGWSSLYAVCALTPSSFEDNSHVGSGSPYDLIYLDHPFKDPPPSISTPEVAGGQGLGMYTLGAQLSL